MRKTLCYVMVFLVAVTVAAILGSCVKKTPAPGPEPVLSGIGLEGDPARYYAPGEPLDLSGASLCLRYSDGSAKTIPLPDESVRVTAPGTNIPDRTNRATLWYGGFKTSFPYYVSPADKVVKSVSFVNGTEPPSMRFAKTELRKYAPTEELNHLTIVVKYRPGKNGVAPADTRYDLTSVSYQSRGITTEGWDATVPGKRNLTFRFLADSHDVPYEIVDGDWIDDAELVRAPDRDYPERNYFEGAPFDSNDAYLRITYNSKKVEKLPLTEDMLKGFDTSASCLDRKYSVLRPDGKEFSDPDHFTYSVFKQGDITNVEGVELLETPRNFLDVRDPQTFAEHRAGLVLRVIFKEGEKLRSMKVPGTDESVLLTYSPDGGVSWSRMDAEVFEELKKKGQVVLMRAAYMSKDDESPDEARASEIYDLTIRKKWIGTEIENWPEGRFTAYKDRPFDFGDAKIRRFYNDGSRDSDDLCDEDGWYLIRDIYALPEKSSDPSKPSRTKYGFDINTSADFLEAPSFDTSGTGTFDKVYLLVVAAEGEYEDRITVNGESVECLDARLYVNYEVLEPAPETPPEPGEGTPGGEAPEEGTPGGDAPAA